MSDPLLTISNHHSPNCGDPPIIDDRDPDIYVGYFANAFGKQWISAAGSDQATLAVSGRDDFAKSWPEGRGFVVAEWMAN